MLQFSELAGGSRNDLFWMILFSLLRIFSFILIFYLIFKYRIKVCYSVLENRI